MNESELGVFLGGLLERLDNPRGETRAVLADLIRRLRVEEADAHDARQSFFNGPRRS